MARETKQDEIAGLTDGFQNNALLLEEQRKFLESLRHQRHDWLNHFQVLLGYLKLQRYDLCEEYIKKVTESTNNDSRIAALGYDPLVVYLLTFNAIHKELKLELEMPDLVDVNKLSAGQQQRFYELIRGLVELYRKHAGDNEGLPNTLLLHIKQLENSIYVSAEYEGRLEENGCIEDLRSLVKKIGNEKGFFVEGLHNNEESIMEFYFPLSV